MNITEQSADGTVYVNVGQIVHLNLVVEFPQGTADPTIEVTLPYNFTTNKTSEQWSISKVEISSVSSTLSCTYSTEFCYYAPQTRYIANDDVFGILKDWSVTEIEGSITMSDPDPAKNILALEVDVRLDDTDAVVNGSEHWLGLGMQFGNEAHIWVGEVPVYTIINDTPEPKMSFKISYLNHSFYKGDEIVLLISIWHDDDSTGKATGVKFTLLTSANIPFVQLESEYTELLQAPEIDSVINGPTNVRIELGTIQIAATPTFRLRLAIDPNSASTAGVHRFVGVADLVWYSAVDNSNLLSFTDIFQFQYSDRPDVSGDLCRDGYTPYMESCYKMNVTEKDWDGAKSLCEDDDSELVMVNNEFEQQFLRSFIRVMSPYKYWIGLKDVGNTNAFTWTTDGSAPTYEKWLPSRPGTSSTENCAAMAFVEVYDTRDTGTELGDWDIVNCDSLLPAICEYSMFEDKPAENPAKEPVIKFSKWASNQTCSCHYDGGSNQCDCCVTGAYKCEKGNHAVCVSNADECPVSDYYDRGFIITRKMNTNSANVIFACGPVYGRLSTKAVPACYVQNDPPDGRWKALPMYVHNVIGSDETNGVLYGIHKDMRSYMRSKDHGATWEVISKAMWDSIKSLSGMKTVEVNAGNWEYNDSGLLYNNNVKMKKDCC
ncbi:uncharacterized protein LOC117114433 [Anneissia japonica]|uniref:uncharacterized protein LOC117114433 n=1 Tax=Anneissia japonica TaxID=1529436 RepID=UPI0014259724|nr:uncharacterized protein LOC117114433 [Anneissia japonica]